MRLFAIILLLLSVMLQAQTNIYFFPGQGSDKRIFDSLNIEGDYKKEFIEYPTPAKGISLKQFAKELSVKIDTTKPYVLVGVSLGGMICSELNEFMSPEKVIIISSAKNRGELPLRYRFQKYIPVYAMLPGSVLHWGAKLMQPLVEPDRNKNEETFKAMLYSKDPLYLKRTIGMIINWDNKTNSKKIYHIHGTKDHTLPYRKIKSVDHTLQKGSHMMTLTRADEISKVLNGILKK